MWGLEKREMSTGGWMTAASFPHQRLTLRATVREFAIT